MIERRLDISHSERQVSEPAPSMIALDQLRNGRRIAQRLQQLDEIGPFADLKNNFAHLIGAEHVLA
ncbi:MAG TPA: hypothetical protein VN742_01660, partial [Candidatus Binataceae bacterium]|nr:hypothetical protein [Candidatus Binataceae bacterium]